MKVQTVDEALRGVFVAYYGHGIEERERQYALVLRDRAGCTACLLNALEEAKVAFDRMPAPKGILALYWAEHNDHTPNLPYTEPEPYNGPIGKAASPADDDIRDELERGLWG